MINFVFLLLTMSVSGTFPFIIYLVFSNIFDSRISFGFRYICLKFCMLFYLIPFPLLKYFIYHNFFTNPTTSPQNIPIILHGKIVQTNNGFFFNSFNIQQKFLTSVWAFALLSVVFYEIICFIRFHRKFSRKAVADISTLNILESLKKEMHIKRKVNIYQSEVSSSPFTYGSFHPSIVLTAFSDEKNRALIMQHELQHIKSYDFLFRLFSFVVLLLHCYNPFIYLFFREIQEVQELACDENIMKYLSKEDQKQYGYLLIMAAVNKQQNLKSGITLSFFKNNKIFLKKRIEKIGTVNNCQKSTKLMLILLLLTCSCVPVLAYDPSTVDLRSFPHSSFIDPETAVEVSIDTENTMEVTFLQTIDNIPSDEVYFKYNDSYFITDNGDIFFCEKSTIHPHSKCSHSFVSGQYKTHTMNGKGCIVKVYNAQICKKCKYKKNQVLQSTTTNQICPHK